MKLKRLPEDFRVAELSDLAPTGGSFALYRLAKRGLGTPEAVSAVARRWQIPPAAISFGGLKDRHALTEQFLTIHGGPPRGLEQENLRMDYLGQAPRPFTPADIRANRFAIALRNLDPQMRPALQANLVATTQQGVPNYFDEQRFGSLGESGEFVAQAWSRGDWERTVWLAIADPNRHDTPRTAHNKRQLAEHWGDWRRLIDAIGRPQSEADEQLLAVLHSLLNRPGDFRNAITHLAPQQRGLYLSSFQSFLWNRILAALLEDLVSPAQLVQLPIGPDAVPFFHGLTPAQHAQLMTTELPLPSARQHLEAGPVAALVERTLAKVDLELRQLRVKYPRDSFFSKGVRRAISQPVALQSDWQADELHPDREKLLLGFELPRGSYATIVVKRITEMEA